jgi:hypothetical protein
MTERQFIQNLYYSKCTGKRDFTLHLYLQNMCRKFLTAKKIRFRKKLTFFLIGPVVFAPRTQTYAMELKE